jgi:flagellar basal-body rod protein FlgB
MKDAAMWIDRLVNSGNGPLLEQVAKFSAARYEVLANNIANVDTPGYRSKDLDVGKFYQQLEAQAAARARGGAGANAEVQPIEPQQLLFHDGNNRSMEQLMADSARTAMTYNLAIEMLRRQFSSYQAALRERVS